MLLDKVFVFLNFCMIFMLLIESLSFCVGYEKLLRGRGDCWIELFLVRIGFFICCGNYESLFYIL